MNFKNDQHSLLFTLISLSIPLCLNILNDIEYRLGTKSGPWMKVWSETDQGNGRQGRIQNTIIRWVKYLNVYMYTKPTRLPMLTFNVNEVGVYYLSKPSHGLSRSRPRLSCVSFMSFRVFTALWLLLNQAQMMTKTYGRCICNNELLIDFYIGIFEPNVTRFHNFIGHLERMNVDVIAT